MRFALPVAALLLCLSGTPASADYEATEARLKNAGIDEPLREEIHGAIRRGVKFLLSKQREDGSFPQQTFTYAPNVRVADVPSHPGHTALCALALRHAGTRPAMLGVSRARKYLFDAKGRPRDDIVDYTYHAGICAMLVMADGGPKKAAEVLGERLTKTQERGSWGYGKGMGRNDFLNLSTAQFGALGLWACGRAGAEIKPSVWEPVATLHVRTQQKGRWGYWPEKKDASGRYPQGTFMGLANLLLAEAALKRAEQPRDALLKRVAKVRERGLEALGRDGSKFARGFRKQSLRREGQSWPFYSLYALEKVCIFADVEEVGGVRWYEEGARALIEQQRANGSWGTPTELSQSGAIVVGAENGYVATSFALLFLLRGSETYHPVTPRPVDGPQRPRAAVTPSK